MGKAKRAKEKRLLEEERKAAIEAQKRAEKKENIKIVTIIVSIILVVAILVTSVCLTVIAVKSSGNYLRDKIAITSDNYSVNNAMLAYLFADNFYSQKSYLDYYSSYFNFDTSAPLKNQEYSDGKTWYDYFIQSAADNASGILVNVEAAKKEGITLDDTDKSLIDREIDALKDSAEAEKMELEDYLNEYYALGLKEQDVRDMLELYYISLKFYYKTIYGIEISADAIKEYYDDNAEDFDRVSYKTYTFKAEYKSTATDAEKKLAAEEAKKLADELAKATTPEEFDTALLAHLKKNGKEDEKFDEVIEAALVEGEALTEDSEYSEWLFDDETKVGDTKVIEDDESYTVYMLTSAKAREEYKTHNVRHILFIEDEFESKEACKAAAEAALAEFNKTGKTEDDFAKLAVKHTGDTGSLYNGGLYENVTKGQMVEEFNDWCYDEEREVGDVEIVYTESYGYHVMYYSGEGEAAWSAAARDALIEEEYGDISDDLVDTYTINIDMKIAAKVPDLNK